MLNPVEYLYEGTPIDDFLEMQKPFDFKNFVECSGGRENLFDLITVCMSFPAMFRFVFDENTSAPFAVCFALAQCKDCKIEEFEYNYESKKAECEEILQSADFSELNDRDKAFYMYCQRKGVFIQQESVDYLDTVYGHRMELVEQIQKMEKEALTDYYEQRLHDMAIKVNKLICLCDLNLTNLYGVMNQFGIYCKKNKEIAKQYLAAEYLKLPFSEFTERDNEYRRIFLHEIHYTKPELINDY